jgi:hypothetical protein
LPEPKLPHVVRKAPKSEHVVGDDEDAVGDRDDGLLVATPLDEPAVLGREVAVAFADGAPSTLHEGLAQAPAREAGTTTEAFAGTLVIAGAEAGPGRRVAGGREARHVAPEFGDDRLGGAAGDAGDGVEPRDRRRDGVPAVTAFDEPHPNLGSRRRGLLKEERYIRGDALVPHVPHLPHDPSAGSAGRSRRQR